MDYKVLTYVHIIMMFLRAFFAFFFSYSVLLL